MRALSKDSSDTDRFMQQQTNRNNELVAPRRLNFLTIVWLCAASKSNCERSGMERVRNCKVILKRHKKSHRPSYARREGRCAERAVSES